MESPICLLERLLEMSKILCEPYGAVISTCSDIATHDFIANEASSFHIYRCSFHITPIIRSHEQRNISFTSRFDPSGFIENRKEIK